MPIHSIHTTAPGVSRHTEARQAPYTPVFYHRVCTAVQSLERASCQCISSPRQCLAAVTLTPTRTATQQHRSIVPATSDLLTHSSSVDPTQPPYPLPSISCGSHHKYSSTGAPGVRLPPPCFLKCRQGIWRCPHYKPVFPPATLLRVLCRAVKHRRGGSVSATKDRSKILVLLLSLGRRRCPIV